jgi:hypothetical protein
MIDYENVLAEKNQEKRIEIILTDSYGEDEQDIAFCCYLEDYIIFPFKARIRGRKKSDVFTVHRFTSVTPQRIVCKIDLNGTTSLMPLTEIEPTDKKSTNAIVIGDYLTYIGGNKWNREWRRMNF